MQILHRDGKVLMDIPGDTLYGANLSGVDLSGADLSRADLSEADLTESKMFGSELSWAKLYGAYLRKADLRGADLHQTDLRDAKLPDNVRVLDMSGSMHWLRAVQIDTYVEVYIGCQRRSLDFWLANYATIGTHAGYDEEQIAEYGRYLRLIDAWANGQKTG